MEEGVINLETELGDLIKLDNVKILKAVPDSGKEKLTER